jgi:hypothetical protein
LILLRSARAQRVNHKTIVSPSRRAGCIVGQGEQNGGLSNATSSIEKRPAHSKSTALRGLICGTLSDVWSPNSGAAATPLRHPRTCPLPQQFLCAPSNSRHTNILLQQQGLPSRRIPHHFNGRPVSCQRDLVQAAKEEPDSNDDARRRCSLVRRRVPWRTATHVLRSHPARRILRMSPNVSL